MRRTVFVSTILSALFFVSLLLEQEPLFASPIPQNIFAEGTLVYESPPRLSIPSIALNAPIIGVGINDDGEMDVPDGKSKNVGWYEHGVTPGNMGSAVLAAHVYAAFKPLRYMKPGDDIYVTDKNGEVLHFIVEESKLTKLEDVSSYFLFERSDKPRLNLITCAGKYSRVLKTYTHRLIIYAVLAD